MERVLKSLDELYEVNSAYALSNKNLDRLLSEIKEAKVCTPFIGKFSSGKSALINT